MHNLAKNDQGACRETAPTLSPAELSWADRSGPVRSLANQRTTRSTVVKLLRLFTQCWPGPRNPVHYYPKNDQGVRRETAPTFTKSRGAVQRTPDYSGPARCPVTRNKPKIDQEHVVKLLQPFRAQQLVPIRYDLKLAAAPQIKERPRGTS